MPETAATSLSLLNALQLTWYVVVCSGVIRTSNSSVS